MLPTEILDLPAPRGVRLVALERLDVLIEERVRLGHPEDKEALHDFRVALRRLRSVLRAYRRPLSSSIGKGTRRRLRRLARATAASRDLEVHIAWLDEQRATLTPKQRIGLDALRTSLAGRKAMADAELTRAVDGTFPHLAHRVRDRLLHYEAPVLAEGAHERPLAAVMSARMHRMLATLRVALDQVHAVTDEAEAHGARIAAKRLRYLLEPAASLIPALLPTLERLRVLQDQLGALHDAHVFAPELVAATEAAVGEHARKETLAVVTGGRGGRAAKRVHANDPRPGLIALGERVRARGDGAFASVRDGWLGDHAKDFFAQAAIVADAIDEHAKPMVEIERKYLLDKFPPAAADAPAEEIEQGYVPGSILRERLRRATKGDDVTWYRTVKFGAGVVRTEIEEECSREVFEAIWPLTEGKRVHKQRHHVKDGDREWLIDHFLDRDLTLAEADLTHAEEQPEVPAWLKEHVVREVTGEADYVNYNLAR